MLKNPELGQEKWNISTTFAALLGCRCLRTKRNLVPLTVIKKIEVFPISGYCRRVEIMWVSVWFSIHQKASVLYPVTRNHSCDTYIHRLTRRNGSKICIEPNERWLKDLLNRWFYLTLNENDSISLCTLFWVINCVFCCFVEKGRGPVPPPLPSTSDFLPWTAVTLSRCLSWSRPPLLLIYF